MPIGVTQAFLHLSPSRYRNINNSYKGCTDTCTNKIQHSNKHSIPLCTQSAYKYHYLNSKSTLKATHKDKLDDNKNEEATQKILKTYEDHKEELEAISFLSSMNNEESNYSHQSDLCKSGQKVFDRMYEKWAIDDIEDLEPTTEIYNLLIQIYANADKDMKLAELISKKMENGSDDGVPTPDVNTYIELIKGWGKFGNIRKAELAIQRMEEQYEKTKDELVCPTNKAYNALLKLWLKSGDNAATKKAEKLLYTMMDSDNTGSNSSRPDTETFNLVMSCCVRNTKLPKSHSAVKVKKLIDVMDEESNNRNDLDPKHKNIVNILVKVCHATDAETLLFDMMDLYQNDKNVDHRPNTASFINLINAWKDSGSPDAPKRSIELLELLSEIYRAELSQQNNVMDIKPDHRVYSAVQNVWVRSKEKHKAKQTQNLLLKLIVLRESTGDEDFEPRLRQWNNVLNACVYTRGNQDERNEAMKILVETFNMMRNSSGVDANHVTYAMFIKGCARLMPVGEKRDAVIENVFRKCCTEGYVSEFVFDTLVASSSQALCRKVMGGDVDNDDGVQIPEQWTRNA